MIRCHRCNIGACWDCLGDCECYCQRKCSDCGHIQLGRPSLDGICGRLVRIKNRPLSECQCSAGIHGRKPNTAQALNISKQAPSVPVTSRSDRPTLKPIEPVQSIALEEKRSPGRPHGPRTLRAIELFKARSIDGVLAYGVTRAVADEVGIHESHAHRLRQKLGLKIARPESKPLGRIGRPPGPRRNVVAEKLRGKLDQPLPRKEAIAIAGQADVAIPTVYRTKRILEKEKQSSWEMAPCPCCGKPAPKVASTVFRCDFCRAHCIRNRHRSEWLHNA